MKNKNTEKELHFIKAFLNAEYDSIYDLYNISNHLE